MSNTREYTCSYGNCNRQGYAKNLCNAHYLRQRNNKNMDAPIRIVDPKRSCKIRGCELPHCGLGRCSKHSAIARRQHKKEELVKACGNSCQDCGKAYPLAVYDFHHRDPKRKDLAIGSEISKQPLSVLLKEVQKCDLLCSNCHRIRHITEQEMPA